MTACLGIDCDTQQRRILIGRLTYDVQGGCDTSVFIVTQRLSQSRGSLIT
jgi:hypothetical protein